MIYVNATRPVFIQHYNASPVTTGNAPPRPSAGIYVALASSDFQFIVDKMSGWFRDRDEVKLVDYGTTDKTQGGYIIEWTQCEIDQLFLAILRNEELVGDYTVYGRSLEG